MCHPTIIPLEHLSCWIDLLWDSVDLWSSEQYHHPTRAPVMCDRFAMGLSSGPLGKKTAGSGDPPAAVASDVVILDRHPGIILALVVQLAASLHHPREKAPREKKKNIRFF